MSTKPIRISDDLNTDSTGSDNAQPKGGLQQYQDDLDEQDNKKHDLITEEATDDPSKALEGSREYLAEGLDKEDPADPLNASDDWREAVEDADEGDANS